MGDDPLPGGRCWWMRTESADYQFIGRANSAADLERGSDESGRKLIRKRS